MKKYLDYEKFDETHAPVRRNPNAKQDWLPLGRYEISESGYVWDTEGRRPSETEFVPTGAYLDFTDDGRGYLSVPLNPKSDYITYRVKIHEIQFYAYNENKSDPKNKIDHLDQNKHNNHPSNLQEKTPSGNAKNATKTSRYAIYKVNNNGQEFEFEGTPHALAVQLGVLPNRIYELVRGYTKQYHGITLEVVIKEEEK
jgi:hypothetical protein